MSNDEFDRGTSSHLTFDVFGHPAVLACGVDLEAMGLRSVVALVSGIGDDAGKGCPDLGLDGRDTVSSVWPSYGFASSPECE